MYPYLNIGPLHLGTFGLLLWLAAVVAAVVLHRTFLRDGVDADALNVVAMVVISGVIGAKLWHELEDPAELVRAMKMVTAPGWGHPGQIVMEFLHWFQAGFAWFGGLLGGIGMLVIQGRGAKFKGTEIRVGGVRMLDLAAPAAFVGYGVGRIGCLTSGDGDYGRNTLGTFWGVHMKADALVPPSPRWALVLPTPLWEFVAAMVLAFVIWQVGKRMRPVGWLTGLYLVLSGTERFIVEFWRINPKLYFGHSMSNAQVAALGSVVVGALVMGAAMAKGTAWAPVGEAESAG
ncbi:prolipoprotein diacylglyceryl transferase [Granulicella tundricola MP5ACTX9]|uniref:Prolipoprotein diacylglyceryl transferase n=2 Tax=Granulicella TaxID=940557 RepID=E8WZH9_GRATM|nr:prolipoprotein diacylglyceryl transferase [Granulicella tundricola MP5ACTX9]